jgi:hypothetical protein
MLAMMESSAALAEEQGKNTPRTFQNAVKRIQN